LALVGIIANPAASKDIRRLVAQGRVVPDWEKVNILRRVMLGLQAVGIQRVLAMPDSSHLAARARDDAHLSLEMELLAMPTFHTEEDTVRAAATMAEMGVACLVTLGGDGTNRAVAKGSTSLPLVAISTGTNNVFPTMVEGTLAGLAAGLVAQKRVDLERVSVVSKTLEVYLDGRYRDLALIDVALSRERFVASRAIWDLNTIYEVFLTRAEPTSIGVSAVGAQLQPVSLADEGGLYYRLAATPPIPLSISDGEGAGGEAITVLAPIAPGVVPLVPIAHWRRLATDERIAVERRHCTVALDGERTFAVSPHQQLEVAVRRNGPRVVQAEAALREAAERGVFRSN
jgi:NAD kinase